MNKRVLSLIGSIVVASVPAVTTAQVFVTTQIGGIPNAGPATQVNFNGSTPSILTFSGPAGIVSGGLFSVYVPPYFSGSTASFFGESPANGLDLTPYVDVQIGGSARFSFSTPQNYFGLFCGSVDMGNRLTFFDGASNVLATITGADLPGIQAFGDLTAIGSYYINIRTTFSFSSVLATSTVNSFEIDDVVYGVVPEPTSGALLFTGVFALASARRRRRCQRQTSGSW